MARLTDDTDYDAGETSENPLAAQFSLCSSAPGRVYRQEEAGVGDPVGPAEAGLSPPDRGGWSRCFNYPTPAVALPQVVFMQPLAHVRLCIPGHEEGRHGESMLKAGVKVEASDMLVRVTDSGARHRNRGEN
ncbi:unnamed protein product [Protopolystoma xenopodis]|uniref:Uncharacterized protein n=1 Tax=Protopolystoma xenopodis TaxID=117903 RepID=A0A448WFJ9_9PLAT|nr:unnamed protein product [Protopolystoma xenopodis]